MVCSGEQLGNCLLKQTIGSQQILCPSIYASLHGVTIPHIRAIKEGSH